MKYLLIFIIILIGCERRSPTQEEIDLEAYRQIQLQTSCSKVAKELNTDYTVELPGRYESGHYICNIINHKKNIFVSFGPIELDAIKTFLIIQKK